MLNTHGIVSMLRLQGEQIARSASLSMRALETRKLVWVLADLAHMGPKRGVTGTAGSCRRSEGQFRVLALVDRVEADAALQCHRLIPPPSAEARRAREAADVRNLDLVRASFRLAGLPKFAARGGVPYIALSAWNCPRPGTVQ